MNLYLKQQTFCAMNKNRKLENYCFRSLATKKTDKTIRYAFQKKNILEKSLKPDLPFSKDTKGGMVQSNDCVQSLCFLTQGLKSKEITDVRIVLNRLGIDLKKVPSRLWTKADWNRKDETSKQKIIKKNAYGDLVMISPKASKFLSKNQFQDKPWINYIYKQVINFLHYKSNSQMQSQLLGKKANNHLQPPFKLSKKDLGIGHTLGLKTNHTWQSSSKKSDADQNQVIYPWNILGSGSSSLENWKDNTFQSLEKKVINWEEPYNSKAFNFVEHWNDLEGEPVEVLMNSIAENQFHFVGMITSQSLDSKTAKNTFISFEHHNLYFNPLSKESKPVALTNWVSTYSSTMIDIPFVKVSPINSIFVCQL